MQLGDKRATVVVWEECRPYLILKRHFCHSFLSLFFALWILSPPPPRSTYTALSSLITLKAVATRRERGGFISTATIKIDHFDMSVDLAAEAPILGHSRHARVDVFGHVKKVAAVKSSLGHHARCNALHVRRCNQLTYHRYTHTEWEGVVGRGLLKNRAMGRGKGGGFFSAQR